MELKLMASPKRLKAPSIPSVEKTLTSTEQSAIEYITVMQNGQDTELKKKFVAEKITSEVRPIFEMATKSPSAKSAIHDNATVVKSVDYEMGGKKATAVLIVGDKESEKSVKEIVLVSDGKVGWVHTKADSPEQFDKFRGIFNGIIQLGYTPHRQKLASVLGYLAPYLTANSML
ncbi:hypothetical protein [Brevibacillus laterosporus]|uniref:hypothetical protein n=1 Tax=Brevibacillus laterosporus TaxID=1465 RepID=UPI0014439008|nr:hypothetical protein [Brevibacillus laterosporus]NKQ21696.1 hypothetical protein [Brevibacillus laterosporus]WNX33043.1 hypothetical protein RWW94_09735 [Brevibacillus laterosporus]